MSRQLVAAAILALFAIACPPASPPCVVPVSGDAALELLQGTWTVRAYDGEVDGEIQFDGGAIRTRWENVTLVGSWEHVASLDNAHVVRLRIDEAWEGDVRQRYGRFDEIELELVFGNANHLYALQPDGAWTEWERVDAVPPVGP